MHVRIKELIALGVIALLTVGCNGETVTSEQQVTLS